ncbi:MAG TPA: hypothetical protein PK052_03135 [Anaerohalosphaeraceae bacterium]|nr:hypothetical protein [Anaerohalosphaeraceae bacterium]HOL30953.1 hypothetical protein [Anaerohalosphaeraceae bacterium]HOM75331.1 hypothetical protein [Anaerohalosphaeraceae bacterium]HPC63319.1 hypothetical protein [Anaerohalosphaeraceae bacterium]HPO68975.1 hypothetical protein [Anaerohalosphaeraceae bacterium]
MTQAGTDERKALQILSILPASDLPAELASKSRWDAVKHIHQSIKKQEQVVGVLETCITNLQTALWLLSPLSIP